VVDAFGAGLMGGESDQACDYKRGEISEETRGNSIQEIAGIR